MPETKPTSRAMDRETWRAIWQAARFGRLARHARGGREHDHAAKEARDMARMVGRFRRSGIGPGQLRLLANWAADLACQERWRRFPRESLASLMAYGSGRMPDLVLQAVNEGKEPPYRDSPKVRMYEGGGVNHDGFPDAFRFSLGRLDSNERARKVLARDSHAFGHPFRLTGAGRAMVRVMHQKDGW